MPAQAQPGTTSGNHAAARGSAPEQVPALLAKAALRRLLMEKLEPTPDNYLRAYQQEQGATAPVGHALPARAQRVIERLVSRGFEPEAAAAINQALAAGQWDQAERAIERHEEGGKQLAILIDRILRGVERHSKTWTTARKKDSLHRVLDGSSGDAMRLQQRLRQLVSSWESDVIDLAEESDGTAPAPLVDEPAATALHAGSEDWSRVVGSLEGALQKGLPRRESNSRHLADALAEATRRIGVQGATPPLADEMSVLCQSVELVMQHRNHLVEQLGALCQDLTESLGDLAEDDSWARGQAEAMRLRIEEGLTARGVKSVSELLRTTRARQGQIRGERETARESLKSLIQQMLSELGTLGSQTGRFSESVGRYAETIDKADSLESLAGAVREMVQESQAVQGLVTQTQDRLQEQTTTAAGLSNRVVELEAELRRLSDEVSTDQLTQIANRRGLMHAFEAERSRARRGTQGLAVGLLDIDNFKRLNDELGHAAGDTALKSLAEVVSKALRPTDLVARYGGEEFVVLLPDTPLEEAQQILTRLQRSLSGGLFMHERKTVLVTFSAGVTVYRDGETIEDALERSDQALYEAKRSGKNRTVAR